MTAMTMRERRSARFPASPEHPERPGIWACAVCAALAAAATGCGGNPGTAQVTRPEPPTDPDGPDGDRPGDPGEPSYHVHATATAGTADEAYEAATAQLEIELYASEAWARALDLPVHDRAVDPHTERAAGGQVTVTVGLEQPRVIELLEAMAAAPWRPEVPQALADRLVPAAERYYQRFLCARRLEYTRIACDPETLVENADDIAPGRIFGPTHKLDAIAAEVRAVAASVRLRAFYAGGVPLAASGRPLRPVTVIAEHEVGGRWLPLADLPVAPGWTDEAAEQAQGVSDRDGVVRLVLTDGATVDDSAVIANVDIDRAALLGPMAKLWPEGAGVAVVGRRVGMDRFAVVATERVQGRTAAEQVLGPELAARLVAAGGAAEQVASVVASDLAATTPARLPIKLTALADTWQGAVDVVLLAEVDSDYASQLGAHRVRYDARGRVRVYDVWTGAQIGEVEDRVTVSGVGEARADRAARAKLAAELAAGVRVLAR